MQRLVNGVLVDLTAEEIAAKQASDAAWTAGADSRAAEANRIKRNQLLADSDWTQLPDAPADKTVWAAYRQELRDVTSQTDPFNIVLPVAPDSA